MFSRWHSQVSSQYRQFAELMPSGKLPLAICRWQATNGNLPLANYHYDHIIISNR
jgi:hypothetical protein